MIRFSFILIGCCILQGYEAEKCSVDVIFMVDSSDITRSGGLFGDFMDSLKTFVNGKTISDQGLRVGSVFFNDNSSMTIKNPLQGNRANLLKSYSNRIPLGIALRLSIGINSADELFNTDGNNRPGVPRIAILITAGTSKRRNFPTVEAAKLKANSKDGRGMKVYAIGVRSSPGDQYNLEELNIVASTPQNVITVQRSEDITDNFNIIINQFCENGAGVVNPTNGGICDMVTAEVKIGVGPLPFHCDKYVQCYFRNASSVVAVYRQCPYGHYWNQVNKTCDYSSNVLCPYAICTSSCKTKYKMDGSCRSYWQCNSGKQEPKCCPMGYAFVAGHGCKPDSSCKDSCPSRCKHAPCDKKPNWSNEMSYDIYMGLFGYLPMSCSPGRFDVAECACSFSSNINNKSCYQAVTLNFTDPKQLQTKDDVGIIVQNVSVVGGFAVFNSNSHIHFNLQMRNKTMNSKDCKPKKEVSHQIVVSFKYREVSPIEGERVLIGTGDCGKGGRMYITYDTSAVHFIVESRNGAATNITILTTDFPENEWKEINFIYDGSRVEGRVSSGGIQHVSKLSAPSTKLLECGLGVGIGGLMSGFKGQLDDLSVYICSNSY